MDFTLISISQLDEASCAVMFNKGMCTVKNPSGCTMATIPQSDGLYHIVTAKSTWTDQADIASTKMSISEAHGKFRHITHDVILYTVTQKLITGINLDLDSKPEFCEPGAKAKSAEQTFPKESQTRVTKYGEWVHWDLWRLAIVKSHNSNYYVAAHINDATHENKLYFRKKKSETCSSYKRDEELIKTQSGNHIKVLHNNQRGEFLSKELIQHQDNKRQFMNSPFLTHHSKMEFLNVACAPKHYYSHQAYLNTDGRRL